MEFPKLYARSSGDKIIVFTMCVTQTLDETTKKSYSRIHREWGDVGGIMTPKFTDVTKGKNVGKKNATTPYQQAVKDAGSIWRKKKDEGYYTLAELKIENKDYADDALIWILNKSIPTEKTDAMGRVKPMLLYEARTSTFPVDEKDRVKPKRTDVQFPCIVQTKRDGLCTTVNEYTGLTTRGGKDRHTNGGTAWNDICPQIIADLKVLYTVLNDRGLPSYKLHGEVYLHGLTLQGITSACKKKNEHSECLQLHVFDIIDTTRHMYQRRELLQILMSIVNDLDLNFILVAPGVIVKTEERLLEIEDTVLKNGYEGLVIRHIDGTYRIGARSRDVLKMVRMDKTEVTIINIVPLDKEPTMGKFICSLDGLTFFVTPGTGYDHDDRRDMLKNPGKYIGKKITITHRGFTDDGVPRIATAPK